MQRLKAHFNSVIVDGVFKTLNLRPVGLLQEKTVKYLGIVSKSNEINFLTVFLNI